MTSVPRPSRVSSPLQAEDTNLLGRLPHPDTSLQRSESQEHTDDDGPSLLPAGHEDERPSVRSYHSVSSISTFQREHIPQSQPMQEANPDHLDEISSADHEGKPYDGEHSQGIDQGRIVKFLSAFVTTVPFLLVVGVLLHLIFANRVERRTSTSPNLRLPSDTDDADAYLINFSATQLTTLASWASNIATLVPGFLMTLYSHHLASMMGRQSQNLENGSLPTPYQLGLLLEALDAKLTSLWNGLMYLSWKRRERMNAVVRLAYTLLLAAFILSCVIWAADTWLHVTVSTVVFLKTSPSTSTPQKYGYKFPDVCSGWFNDTYIASVYNKPCDDLAASNGDADAYQILVNSSSSPVSHRILTSAQNGTRFSYLAPSNLQQNLDYVTSTVAVSSSCQSIGQKCNLAATQGTETGSTAASGGMIFASSVTFNCSANFYANITALAEYEVATGPETYQYQYSRGCPDYYAGCVDFFTNNLFNGSIAHRSGSNLLPNSSTGRYANPFYAGIIGNAVIKSNSYEWLKNSPQVVDLTDTGEYWFVLGCDTTAYNLTYSWVNNTIVSSNLTLASDDVADIIRTMVVSSSVYPELAYSARLAVAQSTSVEQIVSNYAPSLEKMMLAFSANMWTPMSNIEEQSRQNLLVSRVPKAPLFTLVTLCLLFVLLGAATTVIAMAGHTSSKQTREVQARLNVFGVIASRFESTDRTEAPVRQLEDVFEEREGRSRSTRVGLAKSGQGGYTYTSSLEQGKANGEQ